jgi:hypothetical protein
MKAVQVHAFGGLDAMIYQDVVLPIPGPDQVLIRIAAAGVSSKVSKEIASIMIVAAIIIVGIVGIGASVGYRSGASSLPEIAAVSENGPQLRETMPAAGMAAF